MHYSPYRFILFVLLFFLISSKANANHAMGVDLGYECLGENLYSVQLDFYFDCGSSVLDIPPESPSISVVSSSCGELISFSLTQVEAESGQEVSQICSAELEAGNSTCNSGSLPGVEKYVYSAIIELPDQCSDWVFSYLMPDGETRSATITNIISPDIFNIYVQAELNNLSGCNSSPNFQSLPVAYYCLQSGTFTQGAFDADGDSLVFSLTAPLDNVSNPLPFVGGYSIEDPLNSSSFNFNPTNGSFDFVPANLQVSVVAVLVEEFRDGIKVGSVVRDMQVLVLDCTNNQITSTAPVTQGFELCPGEEFDLTFTLIDLDAIDIPTVELNIFPNPSAYNFDFDGTTVSLNWEPDLNEGSEYQIEFLISDEACPISSYLYYSYLLDIVDLPDSGPDLTYCIEGGPLIVEVTGGNTFNWTSSTDIEILEVDGSIVQIIPSGNPGDQLIYEVVNDCGWQDEFVVNIAIGFGISVTEDLTICQGGAVQLNVETPPGNYSFEWNNPDDLTDPLSASPAALPTTTTSYTVTVTSLDTGCSISDSTIINLSPSTAEVFASASSDSICIGNSVGLNSEVDFNLETVCGLNGSTCTSTSDIELGEGSLMGFDFTPYNGFYRRGKMQILFRADELIAMGMESGTVTALSFNISQKYSNAPLENYSVKLACTNVEELTVFLPGLNEVYNTASFTTALGWNEHTFDNSFDWDGTSNLVIEVCHTNTATDVFDEVFYTETSYNSIAFADTDNASIPSGCDLSVEDNSTQRPDLRFAFCSIAPSELPNPVWNPSESLSDPFSANPIASPTETTTYTVSYSDSDCIGSAEVTIFVPSLPENAAGTNATLCGTGTVVLGGANVYGTSTTFSWLPETGLSNPSILNPTATIEGNVDYSLTVDFQDDCGTVLTDLVSITLAETPFASDLEDVEVCLGNSVNLNSGIDLADSYYWTPVESLSCGQCPSPLASPTETTTYNLLLEQNGCFWEETITVNVLDLPDLSISGPATAERGEDVLLEAIGDFSSVEWTPAELLDDPFSVSPMASVVEGTNFTAVVENEFGCSDEASFYVSYADCGSFLLPSAFSPNNDGMNDLFFPQESTFDELVKFEVYNRWGQQIFKANNTANLAWDGTYNGEPQEAGTYTYIMEALCDGQVLKANSWIVLIR